MAGDKPNISKMKTIPITKDYDPSKKIGEAKIDMTEFDKPDFVFAPEIRILEKVGNKITKVELVSISLIPDKQYKKWEE
jgi:hypothetical protein